MAEKIREFESSYDLKQIAEDVLPELEKFLESPEEKTPPSHRNGIDVSFVGIRRWSLSGIVAIASAIRGFLRDLPRPRSGTFLRRACVGDQRLSAQCAKEETRRRQLECGAPSGTSTVDTQTPPRTSSSPSRRTSAPLSVTEGTTTHLDEKQPVGATDQVLISASFSLAASSPNLSNSSLFLI